MMAAELTAIKIRATKAFTFFLELFCFVLAFVSSEAASSVF